MYCLISVVFLSNYQRKVLLVCGQMLCSQSVSHYGTRPWGASQTAAMCQPPWKEMVGGREGGRVCVCWKAAYLQPWRAPNCLPVISSLTPALLFVMAARWQAVHHRFPLNRLTFIISPQKKKKKVPSAPGRLSAILIPLSRRHPAAQVLHKQPPGRWIPAVERWRLVALFGQVVIFISN